MLWCEGCQTYLQEDELDTEYEHYEDVHYSRPYSVCPECGSDNIVQAKECTICSEYFSEEDCDEICGECRAKIDGWMCKVIQYIQEQSGNTLDFEDAGNILIDRAEVYVEKRNNKRK